MMNQQSYEQRVKRAHLAREIIEVVLLVGIIIFVIQLGIKSYSVNTGGLMGPSLKDSQLVIVSKLSYVFGSPQRGDVIIYNNPLNTQQQRIQRVIGIPGDTVKILPSSVSVNGHILNEPYVTIDKNSSENPTAFSVTLGKNQYFILNDHRSVCTQQFNCTNDSRDPEALGVSDADKGTKSLDKRFIIGKVVFVYFPLNQMHGIDTFSGTFNGLATRTLSQPPLFADVTALLAVAPIAGRVRDLW
jgi:signal peptidase I